MSNAAPDDVDRLRLRRTAFVGAIASVSLAISADAALRGHAADRSPDVARCRAGEGRRPAYTLRAEKR